MDDSQRLFLAQHRVPMLEQCCNHLRQCRNYVATLYCGKIVVANRPVKQKVMLHGTIRNDDF